MKYRVRRTSTLALAGVVALPWIVSGFALQDAERAPQRKQPMQVRYLEIVTSELDATCDALESIHGVTFGDPVAELGHARTVELADGNRIGVRAPMQAAESPTVRPYVLVEDIDVALKAAEAAGAMIAHPPLEIPGQGTFAIYVLGGVQHGLWKD